MARTVHHIAATGFGEGTNDQYDKVRPSYPASALQVVHSALTSNPTGPQTGHGLTILEPGSGTGIFSRLLLSPPTPSYPTFPIATLVGVEPSSGMRGAWTRGLERVPRESLEGKRVEVVDGAFDDFSRAGVAIGEVDGVVVAQAWHWCSDYGASLREVARFLRPGAPLVLIWNIESNGLGWYHAVREHYERIDMGSPQYYRMWWRKMFDVAEYRDSFDEAQEGTREWSLGMTEDQLNGVDPFLRLAHDPSSRWSSVSLPGGITAQLVSRLFTKSYLTEAHLNGQSRVDFEAGLRKLIREGDKEWVDKDNGVFLYRYNCDYVILRKKAT